MRSGRRLVSGTSGATPRSRKACQAPAPGARSRIHTQTSNLFTPKPFKPPILSLFPTTPPKPQPVLSPPLAPTPLPYLSLRGTLSDFRGANSIFAIQKEEISPLTASPTLTATYSWLSGGTPRVRPPPTQRFPRSKLALEERKAQPPPPPDSAPVPQDDRLLPGSLQTIRGLEGERACVRGRIPFARQSTPPAQAPGFLA